MRPIHRPRVLASVSFIAMFGTLLGAVLAISGQASARLLAPSVSVAAELQGNEVTIPETPAGKRLAEFLKVVKAGDEDARQAFSKAGFVKDDEESVKTRTGQLGAMKSMVADAKLVRVASSAAHRLTVVMAVADGEATITLAVEEDEPHRIASLSIARGPAGETAETLEPLTAKDIEAIIEESAQQLEEKYVFPEVGDKMAAHLRGGLKDGKYSEISEPDVLAQQLTEELREICHDRHLGMRPAAPPQNGAPRMRPRGLNHGFVKTEMLPGNIGYIKFNAFQPTEEALRVAAAAMEFVRDADALIFDVRENGGGSPRMIVCLTSYLFEKRTHLNSFYDRITGETTETWTTEETPDWRFPADMPVYVLTSNYTFSAAEEFTYNLQCLKRATIVGETTGGGAHPVRGEFVGGRMMLRVPYARAINPVTNTNWEGVGITPDVECSAADALETAVEHAKAAIDDAG